MSEQMLEYMSGHIPGPKPDHMSDVMAGNISELMRTRTSGHSPQHFPAFMIDDVSEQNPDLKAEQTSKHCVNPHVCLCHASLSIHTPCLLPSRLSGWGSK